MRVHRINASRGGAKRPLRRRRLQAIVDHPHGRAQLPHRAIELTMMSAGFDRAELAKAVEGLPVGHAVVVHGRLDAAMHTQTGLDVAFEPVPLGEAASALAEMCMDRPEDASEALADVMRHRRPASSSGVLAEGWQWARAARVLFIPAVVLALILTFVVTLSFAIFPLVMMVVLGLLLRGAKRLVADRQWWIVPGGLIYREHRLWRRDCRGGLVTRATSPLLLDTASRTGVVMDRGKVLTFAADRATVAAIVRAWRWPTAPPSENEALAFLGLPMGH